MNKKNLNIVLVEDQKLFAHGLREVLNKFEGIGEIKIIEDGDLLLNELEHEKIDIVYLDLNLPNKNGLAILSEIKSQYPDIIVVILTMHQEKVLIEKARKIGANAYLTKDVSIEELKETIFLNANSPFYISKNIRRLVEKRNIEEQKKIIITDREKEILNYLVKNQTIENTAKNLNINIKTIEIHLKNIQRKLNIGTVSELINHVSNNKII